MPTQTEEQRKAAVSAAPPSLPNPFSAEGAKRIAAIAGQQLAPVDASLLSSPASLIIPPAPQTPLPDYSKITVSTPPIQNTPQQDTLEAERTGLINDVSTAITKTGQRSARKAELEAAAGVPVLNTQLNELNTLIRNTQAEAFKATQKSEDRLAPTFAIQGEQAQIERQRAVKVYGWAAAAEAIQGNIALAQDNIERALAAEFDPLEKEIEAKKFLLDINKDNFSTEEKRRAEAAAAQLDKDKEAAAAAREARKQVLDIMLTAAQYGADNQTLLKIQNAKTPEEATSLAGGVLGNKFASDEAQRTFDNNIKLAQLSIDRAKLSNETMAVTDPTQILAYAQQYASSGKIPTGLPKGTFGVVSQVAKELPKPDGALIDRNTGTKPDISDTKVDGLSALYDITLKVQQLKELDAQRNKGLIAGTLGKVFGSDTQQKYVDLRTEIVDLLSRARTGAALTVAEEKFYADQLPGRLAEPLFLGPDTQGRIDNFASKIEDTLETKLNAQQAVIYGFSKIDLGGQLYTVGEIVQNEQGQLGRVNADGSITLIQ